MKRVCIPPRSRTTIRAEIVGEEYICRTAAVETHARSLRALCGKLIEAGIDPAAPLEVYRGTTMALRVRSIGEGARLETASNGVGFRWAREAGQAPDSAFHVARGTHIARKPQTASLGLLPAFPAKWAHG